MKDKLKKYGIYFIPAIICVTILVVVYAIKGIYPFGDMTITHGDLGQIFINNYHYLYDCIKEGRLSDLLFTDLLYGGSNIWGTEVVSGFFSPFSSLIFLCGQRENLSYFFSYILLIKVALIAISAYFFFDKVYKKGKTIWKVLFSSIYALSGYVMLNYTTIIWLDLVCIFPVLMYSLKRLFDKGKFGLYSILLALCFVISYQLTYMTIFMILAIMPFVLKYYIEKDRRKEVVVALGFGTIIGLLLPCILFLPAIEIYLNSFRTTIELNYLNLDMNTFSTKLSYLIFAALPIVGFIKGFKYIKEDSKILTLYLSLLVVGIIPIVFEEVNKLWHGGSYDSFPFRYGYMPIFILLNIAMYYFSKYHEKESYSIKYVEENKKTEMTPKYIFATILQVLTNVSFVVLSLYVAYSFSKSVPAFKTEPNILCAMIILMIIAVIYEIYFINKNHKHMYKIITFITILQIFVFSMGCVGIQEKYRGGIDHSDHSIFVANNLINQIQNIDFGMYKFKDADGVLLENTSLVTKLPGISSWLLTTKEQVNAHELLGYTKCDFKIDSSGGTIFSDSLLNAKYVFTKDVYSDSVYNKLSTMDNGKTNLYELKNVLPEGIVYSEKENLSEIPKNLSDLEIQNYLYKNLFDKDDDLIEILKAQDIVQNKEAKQIIENENGTLNLNMSTNNELEFKIDVTGDKKLYLNIDNMSNKKVFWILINDKLQTVHTMNEYVMTLHGYPSLLNNGILNLGDYSNETVNIKLISTGKNTCDSIEFGLFDYEKYNNICKESIKIDANKNSNGSKIEIKTVSKENQKMFLPIAYDENWECSINGKKVDIEKVFTGFISLDLDEGENKIELEYVNHTFKYGAILSVTGFFLFVIAIFLNRKNKIVQNKLIQNVSYISFIILMVGFYIIVYGYGIIKSIINCISIIFNIC